MRAKPLKHGDTVAASLRHGTKGFELLSPFNEKTPKGEALGYLTAIMYLAPHTLAGGATVCPHSTAACREGCLYTAGRGKTPRVEAARIRRTRRFQEAPAAFFAQLCAELERMSAVADSNEMRLAIRLNGTSDILWERLQCSWGGIAASLFGHFPRATFYDYTRTPAAHRRVPGNWRLTFSLADDPLERAAEHFAAGRSVAAVAPEVYKAHVGETFRVAGQDVHIVDGDEHDLRFLDPSPALVLLKPKGRLIRGGPMVRHGILQQLARLT